LYTSSLHCVTFLKLFLFSSGRLLQAEESSSLGAASASSFFEYAARNEGSRRQAWDTVWFNMDLISRAYIDNIEALSAEHSKIFSRNLDAPVKS
jgi:hypothetical protein